MINVSGIMPADRKVHRKVENSMNAQRKDKGFTIIEVVLVLAIAALIFLMIFIALPALQRGQRDTGRKNDANKVASAIGTWKSNHRGDLPNLGTGPSSNLTEFRDNYVTQLSQYDVGSVNRITAEPTATSVTVDIVGVWLGHRCSQAGDGTDGGTSTRGAAVFVRLEQSDAVVCTDA